MSTTSIAELVGLVGLLTALALYVMLLVMVLRDRAFRKGEGSWRASGSALTTALLGLVWNLGALGFLGSDHRAPATLWQEGLTALAYAALGFLPAVFVDTALRPSGRRQGSAGAWTRTVAYGMSGVAAVLHLSRVAAGGGPSAEGLRLLAVGFVVLVPAVLWLSPGGERFPRGVVSAVALLAFAVCALHLAQHLPGHDTWSSALFGHHASLPLVLAILYQDYRFAFVDLFLKRALALVLLTGAVLGLYLGIAAPALSLDGAALRSDARAIGTLLGLWVATALAFPVIQRFTNRFVDSVLLKRPDYARVRAEVSDLIGSLDSAEEVLDAVCLRLAVALSARDVRWRVVDESVAPPARTPTVLLPTHEAPRFALEVRELAPGKRLLSDDLVLLDAVALLVARRVDSLRLTHERYERDLREEEVGRLASEAELRALRAQLNPHFLFNALNTLGYLMRAAPERALSTLLDLTRLLRAVLKRGGGDFATLGQEIDLVRAYLAIEGARFEDRLRVVIDVPERLQAWPVPPLLVQPLVENAIKHGITLRAEGGEVSIVAREGELQGMLTVCVSDSGVGVSESQMAAGRRRGLGLASVEKRLAAYYGEAASLEITSHPGLGTRATLRIPPASASRLPAPAGVIRPADAPVERTVART